MGFRFLFIFLFLIMLFKTACSQPFTVNSVLSSGNWYKLSVDKEGVFKIDLAFLNKLGINTSGLSSASLRLYGNGGRMLPEGNQITVVDDLQEVALQIVDGGDGQLNGTDYCLFFCRRPQPMD